MRYQELPPNAQLAPYVECFWSFEKEDSQGSEHAEPIAPDGCMELIFNLADPFRRHHSDGTIELQPRTILTGQTRGAVVVRPVGTTNLFGIRFHPAGAFAFLHFPVSELTDHIVDLNLVWGRSAVDITELVQLASSFKERARIVEGVLLRKLKPPAIQDQAIMGLANRIVQTAGCLPLHELSKEIHISSRHMERRFRAVVGIGPKLLSRILRFQKTFQLYQDGFENWPMLAIDCGYYDQAHFIRDFKEFSGRNPSSYFLNEPEMAKHFTRKERMSDLYNKKI